MFIVRRNHTASAASVFNLRTRYLRACTGARPAVFGKLIKSAHISGHICRIMTHNYTQDINGKFHNTNTNRTRQVHQLNVQVFM